MLAQLDRLSMQESLIIKMAATVVTGAASARFEPSVLRGIYPGRAAEVDRTLNSRSLRRYISVVEGGGATNDQMFSFKHPQRVQSASLGGGVAGRRQLLSQDRRLRSAGEVAPREAVVKAPDPLRPTHPGTRRWRRSSTA